MLLCNMCGKEATSHCGKCKRRIYCSRECQRSDFKIHKQYCRPPITDHDWLKEMEVLYKIIRTPLHPAPFGTAANAPSSVVADTSNEERTFWTKVAPEWPIVKYKDWAGLFGTSSGIGKELESLAGNGGHWVISFCNFGIMDANGHLIHNLVIHDTAVCPEAVPQAVRFDVWCRGVPTVADLEQCVYQAATQPLEGDPHVPSTILLANRWLKALGSGAVANFCAELKEKMGVKVVVEPRYEAEMNAARNNTDPDGNNFDFIKYMYD